MYPSWRHTSLGQGCEWRQEPVTSRSSAFAYFACPLTERVILRRLWGFLLPFFIYKPLTSTLRVLWFWTESSTVASTGRMIFLLSSSDDYQCLFCPVLDWTYRRSALIPLMAIWFTLLHSNHAHVGPMWCRDIQIFLGSAAPQASFPSLNAQGPHGNIVTGQTSCSAYKIAHHNFSRQVHS